MSDVTLHSPGPWCLDTDDMLILAGGEPVAGVWMTHEYPEWTGSQEEADSKRRECLANGHLLAAAPDLLACLEETLAPLLAHPHERCNMSAETWAWFCRARAAIATARTRAARGGLIDVHA